MPVMRAEVRMAAAGTAGIIRRVLKASRILGVLVLALLLCVSAAAEEDSRFLVSEDGRFRVTLPEGWTDAKGTLDPDGKADEAFFIEAADEEGISYLVFNEEDLDGETLKTFDDYFTALAMGVSGNPAFSDVRLSGAEDRILSGSGMLCRMITFSASYQPEDGSTPVGVACRIYAVQGGGGTCYQFEAWTKAANALEASPLIDGIVDSFTVLK